MSSLWGDALPQGQTIVHVTRAQRPLTDKQILGRKSKNNPCVRVFGAGPEETQCKNCIHLKQFPWSYPTNRHYFKCDLRPMTNGAGTDHRMRWPACGKYEEAQP